MKTFARAGAYQSKVLKVIALFALPIALVVTVYSYRSEFGWFVWENFHVDSVVTALNPRNSTLQFAIGNYYFGGGSYDIGRAKKYYDEAYRIDPTLAGLNYQLARVYFIQSNFYKAREHINKELELYPEYKRSHYVRGLINGYSGRYSEAEKDFKEFLKWKPDSWAGYNDLAWIYFAQGKYEETRDTAMAGLLYDQNNPWLNNSLGVSLLNLGQKEEAKVYLEKSLASFENIGPVGWGKAYPGNNPAIYREGFESVLASIKENILLSKE